MLTYTRYNDTKLAVKGDKDKYHSEINKIGGRWNSRMKGGEGWTVPIEKEVELKKLIRKIKKEYKNNLSKENNNVESTVIDPELKLANFLKISGNVQEDKIIEEDQINDKNYLRLVPELSNETYQSGNIDTEHVLIENLEDNEGENQDESILVEDNNQDLVANNVELEDTNVELEDTNVELEDANDELEDANDELEDANDELEDANVELEDTNVELEDANDELEDANVEPEDANVEPEDANVELEDANVELEITDHMKEQTSDNLDLEKNNSVNSEENNESYYDSDSITRRSYSEDHTYTDDNLSSNNEMNGDYDVYTKDQFKNDASNMDYDSTDDSVINNLKDAKTALDDVIIDSDDDSAVVNNFLSNLLGDLSDEEEWNKKFKKSKERFRRITKSRELHRKKKEERAEKIKFKSQVLNQQKNGLENTESESTFDFYRGLALRNNEQYLSSDSDSECTDSSDGYPSPSTVKEKSREEQIIDLETELLQLKLENERLSTQLKTVLQKY